MSKVRQLLHRERATLQKQVICPAHNISHDMPVLNGDIYTSALSKAAYKLGADKVCHGLFYPKSSKLSVSFRTDSRR